MAVGDTAYSRIADRIHILCQAAWKSFISREESPSVEGVLAAQPRLARDEVGAAGKGPFDDLTFYVN